MAALLPILLLVMALYFVILPQRRRAQAQRSVMTALAPGDRVVTAGGMFGTLVSIDDERARVEVADGLVVDFLPAAIVRRVEPSVPSDPSDPFVPSDPLVPSEPVLSEPGRSDAPPDLDQGHAVDPLIEDHKEEN